jgi:hypothetical protein
MGMTTEFSGASATVVSNRSSGGEAGLLDTRSPLVDPNADMNLFVRDLMRRADQFELTSDIAVDDLFTPRFMHEYSAFESFDQMLAAAGADIVQSIDGLDTNDRWNRFIIEWTRFEGWEEMRDEAARTWIAGELGLTSCDSGIPRWVDCTAHRQVSGASDCCRRPAHR